MSKDEKQSFWTTLPGVLTGIAAVLGAIATLLALVLTGDGTRSDNRGTTRSEWARKANAICAEGYAEIRALGVLRSPQAELRALPESTRIATKSNARLQALERPQSKEDQERIDRLLEASSEQITALKQLYVALRLNKKAMAREARRDAVLTRPRIQRLNRELGAVVCADGV